jgi:hypothetical protein
VIYVDYRADASIFSKYLPTALKMINSLRIDESAIVVLNESVIRQLAREQQSINGDIVGNVASGTRGILNETTPANLTMEPQSSANI